MFWDNAMHQTSFLSCSCSRSCPPCTLLGCSWNKNVVLQFAGQISAEQCLGGQVGGLVLVLVLVDWLVGFMFCGFFFAGRGMEQKGKRICPRNAFASLVTSGKGSFLGICTNLGLLPAYSLNASPAPTKVSISFACTPDPCIFQSSGMLCAIILFKWQNNKAQ